MDRPYLPTIPILVVFGSFWLIKRRSWLAVRKIAAPVNKLTKINSPYLLKLWIRNLKKNLTGLIILIFAGVRGSGKRSVEVLLKRKLPFLNPDG